MTLAEYTTQLQLYVRPLTANVRHHPLLRHWWKTGMPLARVGRIIASELALTPLDKAPMILSKQDIINFPSYIIRDRNKQVVAIVTMPEDAKRWVQMSPDGDTWSKDDRFYLEAHIGV